MEEFAFSAVVLVVGFAAHQRLLRAHEPADWQILNYGFLAHAVAAIAQILIYRYYYTGGDVLAYHLLGIPIADALRSDFWTMFPETVKVFFHNEDARLPFELIGYG